MTPLTPKTGVPAIILTVFTALAVLLSGCAREKAGQPEKVTIAVSVESLSAPLYVAYEKGFFEQQGLQVVFTPYRTGRDALAALIGGNAQFCTVAETPVMFAGLKGEKIAVVATIADSDNHVKITARKDRGIAGPQDLAGKTVGLRKGTSAEYFLHSYLTFHRIAQDRVRTVDMGPEEMAEALVKGTIDAAVAWAPFTTEQQNKLGINGISLENQYVYKILWNIVAGQDFAVTHPETVQKLLRALLQAQHYLKENPEDAQKIVDGHIGKGTALGDINFDIRLSQTLILSLEQEARWAIGRGLADNRKMPNYLRLLYPEGLKAVAPESVLVVDK